MDEKMTAATVIAAVNGKPQGYLLPTARAADPMAINSNTVPTVIRAYPNFCWFGIEDIATGTLVNNASRLRLTQPSTKFPTTWA
jgi:hypothetical protein